MIVINEVQENTIFASYARKVRSSLAKGNTARALRLLDNMPEYVAESAPYPQALIDLHFEVVIAIDDEVNHYAGGE